MLDIRKHPQSLDIIMLSGVKIDIEEKWRVTYYGFSKKITTTKQVQYLEDLFEPCALAVGWPATHMCLIFDGRSYAQPRLLALRTRTSMKELLQQANLKESEPCVVHLQLLPMPDDFTTEEARGYCICNFGGCCRQCQVQGCFVCPGCGNTGCCRTNNCGDTCCETGIITPNPYRPTPKCSFQGCNPCWAD